MMSLEKPMNEWQVPPDNAGNIILEVTLATTKFDETPRSKYYSQKILGQ